VLRVVFSFIYQLARLAGLAEILKLLFQLKRLFLSETVSQHNHVVVALRLISRKTLFS